MDCPTTLLWLRAVTVVHCPGSPVLTLIRVSRRFSEIHKYQGKGFKRRESGVP